MSDSTYEQLIAELNKSIAEADEGALKAEAIALKAEIIKLKTEIAKSKAEFREALDWTERKLTSGTLSAHQINHLQGELDRVQLSAEGNHPDLDAQVDRLQRTFNQFKSPKGH